MIVMIQISININKREGEEIKQSKKGGKQEDGEEKGHIEIWRERRKVVEKGQKDRKRH